MSKGWESKNVAEQQSMQASPAEPTPREQLADARDRAARQRRIQELELQRERVLSEQTSSAHRRSALQMALATIERDLEQLGWSIKL